MNLNPYALALDVILIAVFAFTVYRAWKRGFVDAVAGLLSAIGAVILSRMFGFVLAGFLQREIFDPLVGDIVANTIENAAAGAQTSAETAAEVVTAAITQALDGIRSYTDMIGIPINIDPALLSSITTDGFGVGAAAPLIADIAAPIAETLALWSAYLILFLIAYAILRLVFRVLNLVAKLPILHQTNSLLGCICGVLLGAAYAYLGARLASVVLGILVTRGTLPPQVLGGTVFGWLSSIRIL